MLSANHEHLAVRIMSADEGINESLPAYKFRRMELLPAWFKDYINRVGRSTDGIDGDTDDDVAVPNTGMFTGVTVAGLGSMTLVVLGASMGALWFVHSRKR